MDGSHFGPQRAPTFNFQPTPDHRSTTISTTPEGGRDHLPDREWGLTAGQVVAAVLVIIAACELIGLLS